MGHSNKFKFWASVITMTLVPLSAPADDKKPTGSGPNPFTDCGIGAALFPNTHWAAISSNVIWDIGITGITSATASPETCNDNSKVEAAKFINETYPSIIEDTARGQGEHLTTTLSMLGCHTDVQPALIDSVRADVRALIADPNYATQSRLEKASAYYSALDAVILADFADDCAAS